MEWLLVGGGVLLVLLLGGGKKTARAPAPAPAPVPPAPAPSPAPAGRVIFYPGPTAYVMPGQQFPFVQSVLNDPVASRDMIESALAIATHNQWDIESEHLRERLQPAAPPAPQVVPAAQVTVSDIPPIIRRVLEDPTAATDTDLALAADEARRYGLVQSAEQIEVARTERAQRATRPIPAPAPVAPQPYAPPAPATPTPVQQVQQIQAAPVVPYLITRVMTESNMTPADIEAALEAATRGGFRDQAAALERRLTASRQMQQAILMVRSAGTHEEAIASAQRALTFAPDANQPQAERTLRNMIAELSQEPGTPAPVPGQPAAPQTALYDLAQRTASNIASSPRRRYNKNLLKQFQGQVGIRVDGLYGPQTQAALARVLSVDPSGLPPIQW